MIRFTEWQKEILGLIADGSPTGLGDIDMDELIEKVGVSKQAIQFSIRRLLVSDMIAKSGRLLRRGRQRVCFCLTKDGEDMLLAGRTPITKPGPK